MAFAVQIESFEPSTREARLSLSGELDAAAAGEFKRAIEEVAARTPAAVVLRMKDLTFMASAGLRVLIFAKQKMGSGVALTLVGCGASVRETLEMSGFARSVVLEDA